MIVAAAHPPILHSPILQNNLSLERSATRRPQIYTFEDLNLEASTSQMPAMNPPLLILPQSPYPSPTPPSKISTFQNSLVSAINTTSTQLSTAPRIMQHTSPTTDQLMTELSSNPLDESTSLLPVTSTDDETPNGQQRESRTTGLFGSMTTSEIGMDEEASGAEIQQTSAEGDETGSAERDETGSETESEGDGMDTAEGSTQKVIKSRKPKAIAPKPQPLNHPRTPRRPRKRQRRDASNSPESDGYDDASHSTDTNPTANLLYQSIWEPVTVNDSVSLQQFFLDGISFSLQVQDFANEISLSLATAPRFKSDYPVRAFDADGGEHLFTPECHVSGLVI